MNCNRFFSKATIGYASFLVLMLFSHPIQSKSKAVEGPKPVACISTIVPDYQQYIDALPYGFSFKMSEDEAFKRGAKLMENNTTQFVKKLNRYCTLIDLGPVKAFATHNEKFANGKLAQLVFGMYPITDNVSAGTIFDNAVETFKKKYKDYQLTEEKDPDSWWGGKIYHWRKANLQIVLRKVKDKEKDVDFTALIYSDMTVVKN